MCSRNNFSIGGASSLSFGLRDGAGYPSPGYVPVPAKKWKAFQKKVDFSLLPLFF